MKQVAVIGAAGTNVRLRDLAESVGALVAQEGYSLICGGLQGVMEDACRGFKSIGSNGVTVGILPGLDPQAANEWVDIVVPTGMDVSRNSLVVASARVVIAIGGGAGTLSELALASQLGRPMILLHGGGGWTDRLRGVDFLDDRKSTPVRHAHTIEECRQILKELMQGEKRYGVINSGHLQR
mgnify:CR=1 FL=1